jgi:ribosomal protein S27E
VISPLAFIRGLLENVGAEIDPVRLIRRIKNGLEIPGLKEALIKILQDFHLQISLLDGCHAILNADCSDLARNLQRDQTNGFFITGACPSCRACRPCVKHVWFAVKTLCPVCGLQLQQNPQTLVLLFLCRHVVHASCVGGGDQLPIQPDVSLVSAGMSLSSSQSMNAKIALFVYPAAWVVNMLTSRPFSAGRRQYAIS